jgi:beta-galactosidase
MNLFFKRNSIFLIIVSSSVLLNCRQESTQSPRLKESFNKGWKFTKGDSKDAHLSDFDDSSWRPLDLPHDWAIEGPFTQEVGYKEGYLPFPGVGWYRKSFSVQDDTENLMIEFDGIMRNSKIWLNGEYIGGWPYGYTSFAIDITDRISHTNENILAIRVENQDNSSRWYPGSGIYRNVWLTYTNPVHVAHWGAYVTTPEISEEVAKVNVKTRVNNTRKDRVEITLSTSLVNQAGLEVAAQETHDIYIEGEKEIELQQSFEIIDPEIWDIDDPNLYKAKTVILENGRVVDNYITSFGIRNFRFIPDSGFFLNGRKVKLKGVNLHHDLGPLGTAVNRRATERQLEIMKEMGVNAIRTAHNPPSPEQLEFCDEMGILVIDETFDEWTQAKYGVPNGYNIWFEEWAELDTRALIKRDRNHPSVIMWSIGNEIPELDTEHGKKNARILSGICRELDPTRPVNAGIHLSTEFDKELAESFDVFGMNYWQDRYEIMHEKFPDIPLLSTESSACLSTRGVYHFPVKEIYQGYNHESKQISSYDLVNTGFGALPDVEFKFQDMPWLAGQFVWSGFDYHGEPDPYEEGCFPAHSSYFGIVDMCGFRKDRFYLYQSQWTEEPMIHVLPHWNWEGREGEITPVYVYSNCDVVELIVNGISKGKRQKKPGVYRFKWEDIRYQPGSIRALGYNLDGDLLCEKEIKTAGPPAKVELIPDRLVINADNADLSFITVKITDNEGFICPTANNLVHFDISGHGVLAAVGNGDPTCLESYQKNQRSAFNGLCLLIVRSTNEPGEINIHASSGNLQGSSIQLITKVP